MADNAHRIDLIVDDQGTTDKVYGRLEKQAAAAAKKLEQLQNAQFGAELAGRSHSDKVELLRGRLATLDQQTVKYYTTLGKLRTEEAAVGKEAEQMAAKQAAAARKLANEQKQSLTNLLAVAGIGFSIYGIKTLIADVAKGTYALGQLGAQAITVRDSFAYMLSSVGMNAGMLTQLQVAASGTINSMKLMELSNMALVGLGPKVGAALASSEARLIEISRAALKANPAIGSVEFAYNSLVLGVKRLEKRLVDNIGLQVKVKDANTEYATSIGKTVDELTAEEKQMAMLNAILKGGGRLIEQVGGDVNTMNDSFMRATTSAQEFKIALGEALAPSMSKAAEGISAALDNMTAALSNDEIQKKSQELKNLQETQAKLIEQQKLAAAPTDSSNLLEIGKKGIEKATAWWVDFSNALEIGEKEIEKVRSELALLIGEQNADEGARFAHIGTAASDAAESVSDFAAALEEIDSGDSVAKKLAKFAVTLEELSQTGVAVPSLSGDPAMLNTEKIYAYIDAMERIGNLSAEDADYIRGFNDRIVETQEAMARAVLYSGNFMASADLLADVLFGTGSSAIDLIDNFDKMPPVIQDILGPVMDLNFAIGALRDEMDQPMTLKIQTEGLKNVFKDIDRISAGLVGIVPVSEIREHAKEAEETARNMWANVDETDSLGLALLEKTSVQGYAEWGDAQKDAYNASKSASKKYWTDMQNDAKKAMDDLKKIIEKELTPSFKLDDLAPDLLGREDAVDEHYRRLAAIALRGQEEIDKHNVDWADTIAQIPPEIRAKGIEAMQAWAKDKVIAYGKGLDNSLVNRERIKQLVMEQLQANKMRDELVNEIYAEMGGTVALKDIQAAAGDVTGTGSAMGAAISTGVKDSIDVDGMLKTTASAINTGATKYAAQLKTSGGSVGGIILDGITTAVTDGAPDIVKKLAESLAPSVAKILENNARRSGQ